MDHYIAHLVFLISSISTSHITQVQSTRPCWSRPQIIFLNFDIQNRLEFEASREIQSTTFAHRLPSSFKNIMILFLFCFFWVFFGIQPDNQHFLATIPYCVRACSRLNRAVAVTNMITGWIIAYVVLCFSRCSRGRGCSSMGASTLGSREVTCRCQRVCRGPSRLVRQYIQHTLTLAHYYADRMIWLHRHTMAYYGKYIFGASDSKSNSFFIFNFTFLHVEGHWFVYDMSSQT